MDQATGFLSGFLKARRINKVVSYIKVKDVRILDLGCGDASLLKLLKQKSFSGDYVGVDLLEKTIHENKKVYPEAKFFCTDLTSPQAFEPLGTFDVVTLIAVIEHIKKQDELLQGLKHLLKPGGLIIMTAPNHGFEKLYKMGSSIGIFSKDADEEHNENFPDEETFKNLSKACRLKLAKYEKFLLGANQLIIMENQ